MFLIALTDTLHPGRRRPRGSVAGANDQKVATGDQEWQTTLDGDGIPRMLLWLQPEH